MSKTGVTYLILHKDKLLPWAYSLYMIHQRIHPIMCETSNNKENKSGLTSIATINNRSWLTFITLGFQLGNKAFSNNYL